MHCLLLTSRLLRRYEYGSRTSRGSLWRYCTGDFYHRLAELHQKYRSGRPRGDLRHVRTCTYARHPCRALVIYKPRSVVLSASSELGIGRSQHTTHSPRCPLVITNPHEYRNASHLRLGFYRSLGTVHTAHCGLEFEWWSHATDCSSRITLVFSNTHSSLHASREYLCVYRNLECLCCTHIRMAIGGRSLASLRSSREPLVFSYSNEHSDTPLLYLGLDWT